MADSTSRSFWMRYVHDALPGKESICEAYWSRLETLYAEPQRHYHNLFHMNLLSADIERTMTAYLEELS